MRVICKNIEMIAFFRDNDKINPIRFKMEDKDGYEIIKIDKIMNKKTEKVCGNKMLVYTCSAFFKQVEKVFEIKYDIEKCNWILYKI